MRAELHIEYDDEDDDAVNIDQVYKVNLIIICNNNVYHIVF
jgi:hypothetical protein